MKVADLKWHTTSSVCCFSANVNLDVLQVRTFDIRAVDILEPTKLVIGHECTGVGAGWFLKKVVVVCGHERELDEPETPRHTFPCNR